MKNSGKPFKRCIIHIGTEKTGTSSLQQFFHINREKLRSDGVLYTNSAGKESQYGFFALASDNFWRSRTEADPLGVHSLEELEQYRIQLTDQLHTEFTAKHQCDTLLVSSEHLHSRLQTPEQIKRLKAFLDPYCDSFTIVAYFRRQDRLAVSFYSTKVKSGATNPQLFIYSKDNKPLYYYDCLQIFNNWASVFGEASCLVREYNKRKSINNHLIDEFCQSIGLNLKDKALPLEINRSLNRKGLQFLILVNSILPLVEDGSLSPERLAIGKYVAEHFSGQEPICTREQALEFYSVYTKNNRLLNQRLAKLGYPSLFDDDFSEYPETLDQLGTPAQAVAEVAIEIWRQYQSSDSALFIKQNANTLVDDSRETMGFDAPASANSGNNQSKDTRSEASYLGRLLDKWKSRSTE